MDKPKKILIFSLAYFPEHVGGAEIAIKEITDRISPDEIEFHMITLRFNEELPLESKEGNVHVYRVGLGSVYLSKILFVPLAAYKARVLNKKEKFNGFWAMMTYMLFPIALLRIFGVKKKYILSLQDGDPYSKVFNRRRIKLFSSLLKSGFANVSIVQCISNHLAKWARGNGATCPVIVIPNGVDTKVFGAIEEESGVMQIRAEHGVRRDDVLLITTSRLEEKNAIDTVIQALRFLPTNVKFLIVGEGTLKEKLLNIAKKENVLNQVIFVGKKTYEEVPSYLHASDIFIRPSRTEGMGNSFIEAMAAGLPVIGTQEGGIADFLFSENDALERPATGWVVQKDNPEEIAKAVQDIIDSPEKVKQVTENAKQFTKGKYEWQTISSRMEDEIFSKI